MSKKNRKRSKANKVLKAVSTAGVALGVAALDTNVVFAAELEGEIELQSTEEQKELEETAVRSETTYENVAETEDLAEDNTDISQAEKEIAAVEADPLSNTVLPETGPADITANVESNSSDASNISETQGETDSDKATDGQIDDNDIQANTTDSELQPDEEQATSQQDWSQVLENSATNSDVSSQSYSEVGSISESTSEVVSTELSNYESVSNSNSDSTSVSQSAAESEKNSLSLITSNATSEFESASNSFNSQYDSATQNAASEIESIRNSALANDNIIDENEAKNLAQAIIKYDFAAKGATIKENGLIWDDTYKAYRVSYVDSQGVELQRLYQYTQNKDGTVSVRELNIEYMTTGGKTNQVTSINGDGKPNSVSGTPTKEAPTISYQITTTKDGTQTLIIIGGEDGGEYKNPTRQINPNGTISYILYDQGGTKKVLNLDKNGKVESYVFYKDGNKLLNGSNGDTQISNREVNVQSGKYKYKVAGGTQDFFTNYGYVVIEDDGGEWHKLLTKEGYQVVVKSVRGKNYVGVQTGKQFVSTNDHIEYEDGSYIDTDANGHYFLYYGNGNKVELIIGSTDYYTVIRRIIWSRFRQFIQMRFQAQIT